MTAEDYELMPEKKLFNMRQELSELKKKAANVDPSTGLPKQTLSSLENLNRSINSLLGLFQTATEELKLEERDETLVAKQLKPIAEKVDILLDQNEKIAKAIVAIADMVKEKVGVIKEKEDEVEQKFEEKPWEKERPEGPPAFPPPGAVEMPIQGMRPIPPPRPTAGFPPPPPPMGAPEPMPPWDMPGQMPGFEEKGKKKGLFGKMFK